MTETKFPWGTVTHETDPETGEMHVDVFVAAEDDIAVSTAVVPSATNEEKVPGADPNAEIETFPWGAVLYTSDVDMTDVDVLVEAEDGVSLSVTTISADGTRSTSRSVVRTTGGSRRRTANDAGTGVNVSQSTTTSATNVSQNSSTSISQSSSVSQSSSTSASESVSIDIDDGDETD